MKYVVLTFIILASALRAQAGIHLPSLEIKTYSPEPGIRLQYIVAKPGDFDDQDETLPLWIFQPGDGTILQSFSPVTDLFLAMRLASELHVVFVFPELRRELDADNLLAYCKLDFFHRIGDLNALIDIVKTESRVNTQHVYLFGHSAGSEIVTLTSRERTDIAGIATYGGGVASANERNSVPDWIKDTALNNKCNDPSRYSQRSGIFWHQLFYESNLFQAIQSLKQPYLAMLGSNDLGDGQDAKYAVEIEKVMPDFQFTVIPGMAHDLGLSMAPWKAAEDFFAHH